MSLPKPAPQKLLLINCDGCGQQLDASQATEFSFMREIGEQQGEWVTMTICPNCVAKQDEALGIIAWAFVAIAVSGLMLLAVGVAFKLLNN